MINLISVNLNKNISDLTEDQLNSNKIIYKDEIDGFIWGLNNIEDIMKVKNIINKKLNNSNEVINENKSNDIWFTANMKFDSPVDAYERNFENVNEMDDWLINKWNKIINVNDKVYHLGNFGNYDFIEKLNGKITIIFGDYEKEDYARMGNLYLDYLRNKNIKFLISPSTLFRLKNDKTIIITSKNKEEIVLPIYDVIANNELNVKFINENDIIKKIS